ncbi:2-hydroxyacid dehydrogenase [Paenibacillus apii]|uniref:2-hydroxyacid dehydrogenase n=1 Tax=Paenibacillus apii TaxID=1850370 RepID=UPI00143CB5FF|nr:D-glycerate dehydrogenase [Paenibacillus apii]NJJ40554.1 D-glycerate dehydrogenase [Paenibacillus apii]
MRPKVYIAWPIPDEIEAYLAEHCSLRKWKGEAPIRYEELKDELKDAEGLLLGEGRIDAELLEQAPHLRVVSTISAGYNNLDIEAMKHRSVIGTNNPGISNESVADLVLGLALAAARKIVKLDRYVKEGCWTRGIDSSWYGLDVHHSTIGIIGMGGIGQEVAKRAKAGFDMKVLYYNRSRRPEVEHRLGAEYCSLEELLTQSDFIVVMLPLTAQTEHLIGGRHFDLMKPSAVLINASRGSIVNERALVEALRARKISAAALDVYEFEPVNPDHPLLNMDNVITLPHVGSATAKTRFNMVMSAARNLVAALKGETPPFLIREFKESVQN